MWPGRIENILRKSPYHNYKRVKQVLETPSPAFHNSEKDKFEENESHGRSSNKLIQRANSTSRFVDLDI